MIAAYLTGLAQVFLVAFQTRQIAEKARHLNIFMVGVLISAVWVFNVRAAVGTWQMGIAYVLGAGTGTYLAMKVRFRK